MSPDATDFFVIGLGPHKVVVDENEKFILGYAEERGNKNYVLCPFVEDGPVNLGPKRIKIRITGDFATSYITVLDTDPLDKLFFHRISPGSIRDVKAIPNPADQSTSG